MSPVIAPENGTSWLGLSANELPLAAAVAWATRPDCGAVVSFSGTARDHSPGRPDVHRLVYEAYDDQVLARLAAIEVELRRRWPEVRAVAMLHRTGEVPIGASAVIVVVSSPHRAEAFAAAQFGIDELKATAPIWKLESWAGGEDWGTDGRPVRDVAAVPERAR
jgi:molybdopterin synthase catalytic subunit